jgi:hypothetical protein
MAYTINEAEMSFNEEKTRKANNFSRPTQKHAFYTQIKKNRARRVMDDAAAMKQMESDIARRETEIRAVALLPYGLLQLLIEARYENENLRAANKPEKKRNLSNKLP